MGQRRSTVVQDIKPESSRHDNLSFGLPTLITVASTRSGAWNRTERDKRLSLLHISVNSNNLPFHTTMNTPQQTRREETDDGSCSQLSSSSHPCFVRAPFLHISIRLVSCESVAYSYHGIDPLLSFVYRHIPSLANASVFDFASL